MTDYARVLDGAILERRTLDEAPGELAPNKGRWLPVVAGTAPTYDAASQRLVAATSLETDRVVDGWTVEAIPLDQQKATKHVARAAEYQRRFDAGFATGGLHVQIDAGSRADLSGMGASAAFTLMGVPGAVWPADYARGWITLEGQRIPLGTPADGFALANAAGAYYAALVQHDQDLATAIEAAADQTALDAVDLTTGWP